MHIPQFSVAPMMDYTDRHCRFIHRLFAPQALLYTEMIVAAAVVRGDGRRLLAYGEAEHPVALQLGGCDPGELAAAAKVGARMGYDEINLNVGCPSDRVRDGAFGACLMLQPERVAACVAAMADAADVPVSVKCRIGVDAHEDYEFFAGFIDTVARAGVRHFAVHARNAILKGLSPKQNREIPPLKYHYVQRLKRERPDLHVSINGGIADSPAARALVGSGLDGVMIGRAAYARPALLAELQREFVDPQWRAPEPVSVIEAVVPYAREQMRGGARLHSISRHLSGLINGVNGARAWRRFLSECAARPDAPAETLLAGAAILRRAA
jgi:tRNA-dihydrouridine synthase A